jgi:hypothetical protein
MAKCRAIGAACNQAFGCGHGRDGADPSNATVRVRRPRSAKPVGAVGVVWRVGVVGTSCRLARRHVLPGRHFLPVVAATESAAATGASGGAECRGNFTLPLKSPTRLPIIRGRRTLLEISSWTSAT